MSAKRLRWTGLACLALSALTAALGYVAQVCITLGIVLLHTIVQVPLSAVGGSAGSTVLPIPRVLPAALLVAGLLLASGLACLFESRRRGRELSHERAAAGAMMPVAAALVDEDPVCGSAHCCLAPYWSERLGKTEMIGHQVSARSGIVFVEVRGDRVMLGGEGVIFASGEFAA